MIDGLDIFSEVDDINPFDYSSIVLTNGKHDFDMSAPTPPVGAWVLRNGPNDVIFPMHRKPRWLTRVCARIFFELEWKDEA